MRFRHALGSISLIAAVVMLVPVSRAAAQRGGGGAGGDAGFGGGRGAQRAPRPEASPEDMARRFERQFEEMASLKPVLKDVKLEKPAKDSAGHIEKAYKEKLADYGKSIGKLLESARTSGAPPEPGAMGRVRASAQAMQDEEYGAVRALLSDEQRATFDKNVTEHRAEEAKREADRRERMQQGGGRP